MIRMYNYEIIWKNYAVPVSKCNLFVNFFKLKQ